LARDAGVSLKGDGWKADWEVYRYEGRDGGRRENFSQYGRENEAWRLRENNVYRGSHTHAHEVYNKNLDNRASFVENISPNGDINGRNLSNYASGGDFHGAEAGFSTPNGGDENRASGHDFSGVPPQEGEERWNAYVRNFTSARGSSRRNGRGRQVQANAAEGDASEWVIDDKNPSSQSIPPAFEEYAWPRFLQQCIDCGEQESQRDALWLTSIAILGATTAPLLQFNYSYKLFWPNLQLFVVAPAASGKGVMAWAYQLGVPLQIRYRKAYKKLMEEYKSSYAQWSVMGKQRGKIPEPEKPPMRLFYISGNNTGTGILENIADSKGIGCIFSSEADEIVYAISGDYGHWSDVLRKIFDHDPLSYNRRINKEYREVPRTWVTVAMSGTPGQVAPLIPSPENGLFSRQVFYYMKYVNGWATQFNGKKRKKINFNEVFLQWGFIWDGVMEQIRKSASEITFALTEEQEDAFDQCLASIYHRADMMYGGSGRSTVARIAINLLRMMSMVAWIRALDDWLMEGVSHQEKVAKSRSRDYLQKYHQQKKEKRRRELEAQGLELPEGQQAEKTLTEAEAEVERRYLSDDYLYEQEDAEGDMRGREAVVNITRRLLACPGISAAEDVTEENVKDGVVSRFQLSINEEDFSAMLKMAHTLYRHSAFVMDNLPKTDESLYQRSPKEMFLSDLPASFSRQDAVELGAQFGLSEQAVDRLLMQLVGREVVVRTDIGQYAFSSKYIRKEG
jgi:hypothetical protein